MEQFKYNKKTIKLTYTYKAMMQFENISEKMFALSSITDYVIFLYAIMLDQIDGDFDFNNDYMPWLEKNHNIFENIYIPWLISEVTKQQIKSKTTSEDKESKN